MNDYEHNNVMNDLQQHEMNGNSLDWLKTTANTFLHFILKATITSNYVLINCLAFNNKELIYNHCLNIKKETKLNINKNDYTILP